MMKKKIHYAYVMLAACCLVQGGTLGVIHNCRGIFYGPICRDLGVGLGSFTFYMLFFGLFSCIMLPFAGRVFHRVNIRWLLCGASVIFAGSVMLQATFQSLTAFYVAGAIQGLTGAYLLFYPVPVLLGNWFRKGRGAAIGFAAATSGLAGAVMSPIGAAMIASWGWRAASVALGLISLLMAAPASWLLYLRPEDRGTVPLGAEETCAEAPLTGISYGAAKKHAVYPVVIFLALLISFICGYYLQLASYGTAEGFTEAFGARMTALCMIGNVISKLFLGWYYDRAGIRRAMYLGLGVVVAGFSALLIRSSWWFSIGSLGAGFAMGMSCVMTPILVREVFGSRDYGRISSIVTISTTVGVPIATVTLGFLYDAVGSYRPGIFMGIAVAAAGMVLVEVVLRMGRSLRESAAWSAGGEAPLDSVKN